MSDDQRVTVGSGNVYAAPAFDEPDLELAKADLAREIVRILDARRLTLAEAEVILDVDQPTLSALLNGRLGIFSMDHLMRFVTRLDRDVEITVAGKPSHQPAVRIAFSGIARLRTDEHTQSVIRRDREIMSGTPVFAGTRVPVRNLIDYLKGGDDLDEFLDQFPSVSREQAVAALEELAMETIGLLHSPPPG